MAKLEIEISAVTNGLTNALKNAEGRLKSFGENATKIGSVLSLAITAPILAIGAAAIRSASDTEESFSKFNTVFRDVAKSAESSFQTLRNEYGLSSLAAKTLLGDTGDLLTGFGFTQQSALELATEVNKLAVDLASFTNFSGGAEGASQALTKALLGERESVKALGISILEEDVKKQVAINTAKGLTFETERQAKAYATLDLAIAQSGNAIGDYSRTSYGFANQTRLLQSRLSDLGSEFGEVLLPLATKVIGVINKLINGFTGLDESTRTTIVVIAGIAAAIGPLSLAIGGLISALPLLIAGFTALTGPIGLIGIAIVGLATLVVTNFDTIRLQFKTMLLEFISFSVETIKVINTLASAFPAFQSVSTAALIALEQTGKKVSESIINDFAKPTENAVDELSDSIIKLNEPAKETFESFSKIAELKNEAVFSQWDQEAKAYNDTIKESLRLSSLIAEVSSTIPVGGGSGVQNINVGLPSEAPIVEIADVFEGALEKIKIKVDDLGMAFNGLGSLIGKAFKNPQFGSFLSQFAQFVAKVIAGALAVSKANAVAGATQSSLFTGPAAAFTLPAFITGALGLVASAFSGIGGGGGGGNSGVGSGAQSQSFTGSGAFTDPSSMFSNVTFEISGDKLIGVIDRTQDRYAKG